MGYDGDGRYEMRNWVQAMRMVTVGTVLVVAAAACRHPAAGSDGPPTTARVESTDELAVPGTAQASPADAGTEPAPPTPPEGAVPDEDPAPLPPAALDDAGIFSDLDPDVALGLPRFVDAQGVALEVNKKRRTLSVLWDGVPVKTYPIALGFGPEGDKVKQGDGRTPEGTFYVCEMLETDLAARYGARSMRISYPSVDDAERGLESGLVSQAQHDAIVEAIEAGVMPPQNTKLGSSIRIHGGGVDGDWTAGCIALRDEDVTEIYDVARLGTPVTITSGEEQDPGDLDEDGIPDQVDILLGALKTALNAASYDSGYQKISYPLGDVDRDKGCCTDVVIRAFRNAGIDLQKEIHTDIVKRSKAYSHVSKTNTDIDHRRVRNMIVYMKKHLQTLPTDTSDPAIWLPGDVVFLDTLPKKGPDHVGIVSWRDGDDGLPLVVNNWTWGSETGHMDLLSWCEVTHHLRW